MLAGVAASNGALTLGGFFEAGNGDYQSSGSVGGDGNGRYLGGGVLGRYDCCQGLYLDASFRVGYLDTRFSASGLRDVNGRHARYETEAAYFGAHAGIGYRWQATERSGIDLFARYLWSRQSSENLDIIDDPYRFDAVHSHRARLSGRCSYALTPCVTPYVEAGFEYEFSGKARATAYGYDLAAPSLRGGTGLAELGIAFKRGDRFTAEVAARATAGRRDGNGGTLRMGWVF